MANFGELLSELRQDRKMTQRDLAQFLHVSAGTISNYEKGVHLPDIDKLINLADFFHVTTDYLLGRSDYRFSPDTLKMTVTEDMTAEDLIQLIQRLSPQQKQAVTLILSDMAFHTAISQYEYDKRTKR